MVAVEPQPAGATTLPYSVKEAAWVLGSRGSSQTPNRDSVRIKARMVGPFRGLISTTMVVAFAQKLCARPDLDNTNGVNDDCYGWRTMSRTLDNDRYVLPSDLPVPMDDGDCDHLPGMRMPSVVSRSAKGRSVNVAEASQYMTVFLLSKSG